MDLLTPGRRGDARPFALSGSRRDALLSGLSLAAVLAAPRAGAAEGAELSVASRLVEEAKARSQAQRVLRHLSDVIGPRLTGSPGHRAAVAWCRDALTEFGLEQARAEPFPFGRGWSSDGAWIRLMGPAPQTVWAVPEAWSPPGRGQGRAVRVRLESEADLAAHAGALKGAVLLLEEPPEPSSPGPDAPNAPDPRFNPIAHPLEARRAAYAARYAFQQRLASFLAAEGVLAVVDPSDQGLGVLHVEGGQWRPGRTFPVPRVVIGAEAYRRITRRLEAGEVLDLAFASDTRFLDDDPKAYTVLADLPGQKPQDLVMVGAHLDSWHAGAGASDNAAGVAVVMEAMRLLKATGAPRLRTVRVALWGGEEQLMLGSSDYVARHFAARPAPPDPLQAELQPAVRLSAGPLSVKPEHARLSAYFNLDEGGGPITGVECAENFAAAEALRTWMAPFFPGSAPVVSLRRSFGSDHVIFDLAGLPAFNFLQGETPHAAARYHTDQDNADYVRNEDLIFNSALLAFVLHQAATAPAPMPRKPPPA